VPRLSISFFQYLGTPYTMRSDASAQRRTRGTCLNEIRSDIVFAEKKHASQTIHVYMHEPEADCVLT
jgi:hypothetical protein